MNVDSQTLKIIKNAKSSDEIVQLISSLSTFEDKIATLIASADFFIDHGEEERLATLFIGAVNSKDYSDKYIKDIIKAVKKMPNNELLVQVIEGLSRANSRRNNYLH